MAISPINNVNNNIRNLSFGESLSNNTVENQSKPKMSTQTKVLLGTGLTALAAVGIYIATRGKSKVHPNTNASLNKNATKYEPFNKFMEKIQEKLKPEWEQLKVLKDGKYVKQDGKYIPATEIDKDFIEISHCKGETAKIIEQYKNGISKRFIYVDDADGKIWSYSSNDRLIHRGIDGENFISFKHNEFNEALESSYRVNNINNVKDKYNI